MEDGIFSYIGGRKFFFALLVTIMAFILVLMEKMSTDSFTTFIGIIGGIYVLGNVGSTVANKLGK